MIYSFKRMISRDDIVLNYTIDQQQPSKSQNTFHEHTCRFKNLNENSTVLSPLSNILIIILCFFSSVAVRFSIMHVLLAVIIEIWFREEQSGNIKDRI